MAGLLESPGPADAGEFIEVPRNRNGKTALTQAEGRAIMIHRLPCSCNRHSRRVADAFRDDIQIRKLGNSGLA